MLLTVIFASLVLGLLFLLFIPQNNIYSLRIFSLLFSGFVLILSTILFVSFDFNNSNIQFYTYFNFLSSENLNIDFYFGLDGISILFFVLTTFLIFLCVLFVWNEKFLKSYLILLFLLELVLLLTFSILNIFLFYIFFEFILFPMYLLIGIWGSREKKIRAAYLLFFYTIACSLLMLAAILYIYSVTGTFNLEYLSFNNFDFDTQLILWVAFFLSFSSKIPMFPFHIWLPEAHVEAPTVGSVLLAGILLKLGVYGFLRYSLTLFPEGSLFFSPLVYALSLVGVIYASITAIKQTDLKKIIAYSSIAHMNLVVLGIFSGNIIGIEAALLQSVSHGFVASALFFLIGMLYTRYHSRLLFYYGGIVHIMPLYSFFMLFFTMSNIALPGTSSFVGEFLLLGGLFQDNFFCALFAGLSVVLSGAYSLWLYNRLSFGNLKSEFIKKYDDISFKEFFILISLLLISLFAGIFPVYFIDYTHLSVVKLFIFINSLYF